MGRLAYLDLGAAAFMAPVAKFPARNIQLLHGERIIRQHGGDPQPVLPPADPNLKGWSAHLIGGKKMQLLGFVEAIGELEAIKAAAEKFGIDERKRKRLAVTRQR